MLVTGTAPDGRAVHSPKFSAMMCFIDIPHGFVPMSEPINQVMIQKIQSINEDLQHLLEINTELNVLVSDQNQDISKLETNAQEIEMEVNDAKGELLGIRKSKIGYALLGGVALAAVATPVLAITLGLKIAAAGSAASFAVGAKAGTSYASKCNTDMEKLADSVEEEGETQIEMNDSHEVG